MRTNGIRSLFLAFFGLLLGIVSSSAWCAPGTPTATITNNNQAVGGQYNISGAYTLTWSAVSGTNLYWINERVNSGAWSLIAAPVSSDPRSLSFTGKTANNTYEYQVYACTNPPLICGTPVMTQRNLLTSSR